MKVGRDCIWSAKASACCFFMVPHEQSYLPLATTLAVHHLLRLITETSWSKSVDGSGHRNGRFHDASDRGHHSPVSTSK